MNRLSHPIAFALMNCQRKLTLVAGFLLALCSLQGQVLIVPQVADGGAWQTEFVLTNSTASALSASISCFQDTTAGNTQTWNLPLEESVSLSNISLSAAATVFLHTPGTATGLTTGWCQIQAGAGVVAYAIFTQRVINKTDQDGTAPAAVGATRVLMPFDNTLNFVTSMGIVNPNSTAESVSVSILNASGAVSQPTPVSLPAMGHLAFTTFSEFSATTGQKGVMELYVSSGTISVLALRFNPTGGFTASPVYAETGAPIIGAGGGGNTGTVTFSGFNVGPIGNSAGFPPGPSISDIIGGQFESFTAAAWAIPYSGQTFGPCSVIDYSYPTGGTDPTVATNFLDAGPSIAISGGSFPAGYAIPKAMGPKGPYYDAILTAGTLIPGATYTMTGAGGTQVGPFSITSTLPSSFSITNWASITSITRANGLTLNWTGSGFNEVIAHVSESISSASSIRSVNLTCQVPASPATLTIPAAALALLPAGSGQLVVTGEVSDGGVASASSAEGTSFTPNLVGGGQMTYGTFAPGLTVYQQLPIL